jgi:hypothetical protein
MSENLRKWRAEVKDRIADRKRMINPFATRPTSAGPNPNTGHAPNDEPEQEDIINFD